MKIRRLVTLTDAVIAIVMTMLILQLTKPAEPTLEGLWNIREGFFAYTLSFFWLGSMWVSLHNVWHDAEKINMKIMWCNIILLFFASLIPYTTSLVSMYYDSSVIQGLYGIVIIIITIIRIILNKLLADANPDNKKVNQIAKNYANLLLTAIIIKIIGFALAITVYPPAMIISVLIAGTYMTINKNKI